MKRILSFVLILVLCAGVYATTYKDLRGTIKTQTFIPTVAAATTTESHQIFCAPFNCLVTKIGIVAQAAVTGDNSNNKCLNILDAGAAGSGSTEVGNLDLLLATDLTAFDYKEIPLNTTYDSPDYVSMDEGDVLVISYEKTGNGVLVPDLLVLIEWQRK